MFWYLDCRGGWGWWAVLDDDEPADLRTYNDCAGVPGFGEGGPEHVFPVTCPVETNVKVGVYDTECDVNLYVLDSTCAPDAVCLDANLQPWSPGNSYFVDFACTPGEIYYVVVEGSDIARNPENCPPDPDPARAGHFEVYYEIYSWCDEICGDLNDNDDDGATDCGDPDCFDTCCDSDGDGFVSADAACGSGPDCDDRNPFVSPAAVDIPADGIDQDCNGVDTCYVDADGDGFGGTATEPGAGAACGAPGEARVGGDCDDTSPIAATVFPNAVDAAADGVDQDCDGVDACFVDADGDGFGSFARMRGDDLTCGNAPGEATTSADCRDEGPGADRVYPGAAELVADGVDQDCNLGDVCYADRDGDGFAGATTISSPDLECDGPGEGQIPTDCRDVGDQAAQVNVGAPEVPGDGIDQDCDGVDHCYLDLDGDGFAGGASGPGDDLECGNAPGESSSITDCRDEGLGAALISPAAAEVPADGVDQDCDGGDTCYADQDGDGFGGLGLTRSADLSCQGPGEAETVSDCRDEGTGANLVNPLAFEIPADGVDQDCDGADLCFRDLDGDGVGTPETVRGATRTCTGPGESPRDDDCRDAGPGAADIFPGAPEVAADGVDQDCNRDDACFQDLDLDGFGTTVVIEVPGGDCDTPGASTRADDCDDLGATADAVHPGATEVPADGVDQDCDRLERCWVDADGDGVGASITRPSEDLACGRLGESARSGDCLDVGPGASAVAPGLDEVCDRLDNDCDTFIDDDDGDLRGADVHYPDFDGDGFGAQLLGFIACDRPFGHVSVPGDCDDASRTAFPGAPEICNDVDDDCDGLLDRADPDVDGLSAYYRDNDGDGFGDDDARTAAEDCFLPPGFAAIPGDCDDARADTNPASREIPYDRRDQDCDGVDLIDLDGDGDPGLSGGGADCNDLNARVNADQPEVPNGADDDCDGLVDDDTVRADRDGDGVTPQAGDCDDADPAVSPFAEEVCNGADDDCDGRVDQGTRCGDDDADGVTEQQGDCNDGDPSVSPLVGDVPSNGIDEDCDGVIDLGVLDPDGDGYAVWAGDCDPTDAAIFPGAPELPNVRDDDCDGAVDELTRDADDDEDGWTESAGDCDDAAPDVHPSRAETQNGIDDDCDGVIDEGSTTVDDDGDAFSEQAGDCDDADPSRNPRAPEILDGRDQDCDGAIDEALEDVDRDGWTRGDGDCDDRDGWANPGQAEMCDRVDNDCDGEIDEFGCAVVEVEEPTEDTATPAPTNRGCDHTGALVWAWPLVLLRRRTVTRRSAS